MAVSLAAITLEERYLPVLSTKTSPSGTIPDDSEYTGLHETGSASHDVHLEPLLEVQVAHEQLDEVAVCVVG